MIELTGKYTFGNNGVSVKGVLVDKSKWSPRVVIRVEMDNGLVSEQAFMILPLLIAKQMSEQLLASIQEIEKDIPTYEFWSLSGRHLENIATNYPNDLVGELAQHHGVPNDEIEWKEYDPDAWA